LEKINKIKIHCLEMCYRSRSSHIGGILSEIDILFALYDSVVKPEDHFILSKGHCVAGLYVILADNGIIPEEWLDTYCQNGGKLAGHSSYGVPGIEISTGALGHGLSIACGMALANKDSRVFVLLGDGECDEGSVWEAILFAAHHKLDNLIAIVDYNKIQSLGKVNDVLRLEPFVDKWQSFGWSTREIDGHNEEQIRNVLESVPFEDSKPSVVIAHTVKGKGISFIENSLLSHYICFNGAQYNQALSELG